MRDLTKKLKSIGNEEKGITMVALVVMVIVLLILASISIAMLTGDNSIVENAGSAKKSSEISSEREIVEISTVQSMGKNKYGNITKGDLEKELANNAGEGETTVTEYGKSGVGVLLITFTKSQNTYEVNMSGDVKYIGGTQEIANTGYIFADPSKTSTEAQKIDVTVTVITHESVENVTLKYAIVPEGTEPTEYVDATLSEGTTSEGTTERTTIVTIDEEVLGSEGTYLLYVEAKIGDGTVTEKFGPYELSISNIELEINPNGGIYAGSSDSTIVRQEAGKEYTLPTATRTSYTFAGWYDAKTGGNKIGNVGDKYTPTQNITLYAQWNEIKVSSINLSKTEQEITYGATAKLTATALPDDALNKNISWSSSNSDVCSVSKNSSTSGEEITLTANKVGTATITATATDGSGKTASCKVTVVAKSIEGINITLSQSIYTYDGSERKPTPTVRDGDTTLTSGTDYTVTYKNNTDAGTATVTIIGKGNYTGTKTATFTINKATPTVTVKITGTNNSGNTLTATATSDSTGAKTYQWWYSTSSDATSGTNISEATSSTYAISTDYVGKYIGCTVSVAATTNYTAGSGSDITDSTNNTIATVAQSYWQNTNQTTSAYYADLNSAIAGASSENTIKLLSSYEDTTTANIDKNLNVNINGYTLTKDSAITINSGCKVALSGYGENTKYGTINNGEETTHNVITNNGILDIIDNVTISSSANAYTIYNTGTVNMEDGTVSTSGGIAVSNSEESVFNLTGGTITSTYGMSLHSYGTITMSGGTVQKSGMNTGAVLQIEGTGNATLTGGTVQVTDESSDNHCLYNKRFRNFNYCWCNYKE